MIDFKKIIAEAISKVLEMDSLEIEKSIEKPKGPDNGDYAFPCFRLAKTLRKAPPMIADDIKAKIKVNQDEITKIEVVGGYVNFFVNKELLASEVLNKMSKENDYGKRTVFTLQRFGRIG